MSSVDQLIGSGYAGPCSIRGSLLSDTSRPRYGNEVPAESTAGQVSDPPWWARQWYSTLSFLRPLDLGRRETKRIDHCNPIIILTGVEVLAVQRVASQALSRGENGRVPIGDTEALLGVDSL